jgi:uncharacterized protein YicC (UPF0701 family)
MSPTKELAQATPVRSHGAARLRGARHTPDGLAAPSFAPDGLAGPGTAPSANGRSPAAWAGDLAGGSAAASDTVARAHMSMRLQQSVGNARAADLMTPASPAIPPPRGEVQTPGAPVPRSPAPQDEAAAAGTGETATSAPVSDSRKTGSPPSAASSVAAAATAKPALGSVPMAPAGSAEPAAPVPETAAPAGAAHDPAFQRVAAKVRGVAAKQRQHAPAAAKAAQAHAAAVGPPGEVASRAADRHVQEMDRQQPRPFDRTKFKAALLKKIADIAPKTLGEADDFKASGKLDGAKNEVHGTVQEGEADAKGPIADTTAKPVDPSGIAPKPVTPLPPPEKGTPPADVGAAAATPKPRAGAEVSLAAGPRELDQQMSSAGVTDEQLKKSNEPSFTDALGAKAAAQKESVAAPPVFRTQEQAALGAAHGDAAAEAAKQLGAMHGDRGKLLGATFGHQTAAKALDEQRRAEVSGHIQSIYETAKQAVEARLKQLDTDVDQAFDTGATAAKQAFENYVDARMRRYKDDRYDRLGGSLFWAKDKLVGMPDEVDAFYSEGRDRYLAQMDKVLDNVSSIVESGLTEAKAEIATARRDIAAYVDGLEPSLKKIGENAAQDIGGKLDELEGSVTAKQDQLIEMLAHKYNERLQQVDDKIATMKAENRGFVDAALDAIGGAIKTIIKLKNMLLGVLSRVADAVSLIIEDPIGFLGNLVAAVKLGVQNFASRIGEHMKQGFMEWLFGAVAQAGIQLPKSFDLKGILSMVLQVLGLTYANFRARAAAILGEKVVAAIETVADVFKKLVTEGPGALWEWIKDKLGDLKAMVIDQIHNFIIEKVIVAGVTWLIGLLNPASAFIKACKAIYDIVMFFVERGSQIVSLVNAVIDSVTAIAKGSMGGAANMVENALARAIPVVIGFLASLLGVGGISEKIKDVIEKIRKPIDAAIDWVITKVLALVKVAGKFIAGVFGKKDKEKKPDKEEEKHEEPAGVPQDPNERLRLGSQAALRVVNAYGKSPVARPAVEPSLALIKARFGLSVLELREKASRWSFVLTVNPTIGVDTDALVAGIVPLTPLTPVEETKVRAIPGGPELLSTIAAMVAGGSSKVGAEIAVAKTVLSTLSTGKLVTHIGLDIFKKNPKSGAIAPLSEIDVLTIDEMIEVKTGDYSKETKLSDRDMDQFANHKRLFEGKLTVVDKSGKEIAYPKKWVYQFTKPISKELYEWLKDKGVTEVRVAV